ncbi:MAG TPA: RIP metalloprotease RseP [Candidatus Atribacteria bacterium]|nr:RIP metalloprotease RseP [Candidatus Atribacteria bacterium]
MIITILAFIFVISLLIVAHEFGHFIMAKWFGVQVLSFAIGYGPKLFSFYWGETELSIRLLPLGGFVKMGGMEGNVIEGYEESNIPPEKRFDHKPLWQRSLIVAAGPIMNIILSIVLLFIVFSIAGIPAGNLKVQEVVPGGPADRAGISAGDIILAVNGKDASNLDEVVNIISSHPGEEIILTVKRGEEEIRIKVIPEWSETEGRALIQVVFGIENKKLNPFSTLFYSARTTISWFVITAVGLLYIILGKIPAEMAGPLGIAQIAGQAAQLGFLNLLMFSAIVSVSLAFFNLLPIPILDGGYLLLFLYEKIRGKPLEPEKVGWVYLIGIILIFSLAIFVTYQDIMRIVTGR